MPATRGVRSRRSVIYRRGCQPAFGTVMSTAPTTNQPGSGRWARMQSDAVVDAHNAALAGTVRTTVHRTSRFHPVTNDLAMAMDTNRCERVNGAFETVECPGYPRAGDLKRLVVIVATDAALRHFLPRSTIKRRASSAYRHQGAACIRLDMPRPRLGMRRGDQARADQGHVLREVHHLVHLRLRFALLPERNDCLLQS
jgi:hypothetical protein